MQINIIMMQKKKNHIYIYGIYIYIYIYIYTILLRKVLTQKYTYFRCCPKILIKENIKEIHKISNKKVNKCYQ